MAVEIERKFLTINDSWRSQISESLPMRQGYLTESGNSSVRIRIVGDHANINIKSATLGIQRLEYEYAIPLGDANEMLDRLSVGPLIEKVRHHVMVAGKLWEVDEFKGENSGLIVAEIELDSVDEEITKPDWAGDDVSDDPRYYNISLVKHPYSNWSSVE